MSIEITDAKGFLDSVFQCTIDNSDKTDVENCVSDTLGKFGEKRRGKGKSRGGGTKRAPSAWNLAVKDCFSRSVGMKECSVWWKSLDQNAKNNVVNKY